jgi:hypothetical protein
MYRSNYLKEHPLYYSTIVNEYTFDDPTLPVVTAQDEILCPNQQCRNSSKERAERAGADDMLYMRYDDEDMRYLYLCKQCRWCWRNEGFKKSEVLFNFGTVVPKRTAGAADTQCKTFPTVVEHDGLLRAADPSVAD